MKGLLQFFGPVYSCRVAVSKLVYFKRGSRGAYKSTALFVLVLASARCGGSKCQNPFGSSLSSDHNRSRWVGGNVAGEDGGIDNKLKTG